MSGVAEIIQGHLATIIDKIKKRMSERGRNASGRTAASLTIKPSQYGGAVYAKESAQFLEHGRGGGKIPTGFIEIIKQWIIDKGLTVKPIETTRQSSITPYERGLNSLSGAIAYSIMKNGTSLHKAKAYDDIYTTVLEEELDVLSKDIAINVSEKIELIHSSI